MKAGLVMVAGVCLLAGCAEDRYYNLERGGYGASLTMRGGSGVRGVYPDAALYAREFGVTNEVASTMIADMRSTPSPYGAGGTVAGQVTGAGASEATAEGDYVNPHAPVIELIVLDYVNPDAPIIELIIPAGVVVEGEVSGSTEPVALPTLRSDGPTNQMPPDPAPIPTPQPQAEPPPAPDSPEKPQ